MQPTVAGARTTLYAGLGEDLEGGEAVGPGGRRQLRGPPVVVDYEAEASDEAKRARLWSISEEFCGFRYPL